MKSELKDIELILKIAAKWDKEEIMTEKDSLWCNVVSACRHLQDEIKLESRPTSEGSK